MIEVLDETRNRDKGRSKSRILPSFGDDSTKNLSKSFGVSYPSGVKLSFI